jgi:carboxyl-terminal processing protease
VLMVTSALTAGCIDLGVAPPALEGPATMSSEANRYVSAALDLMQANSVNRLTIKWADFRALTFQEAASAQSLSDTYPALRAALTRLGDNHSFFVIPSTSLAVNPAPAVRNIPMASRLDARTGYVFIPFFSGTNPTGRVDSTQAMIREVDMASAVSPCGWIVDLRNNGGGNMYPMVAGVGPILGDGVAGHFDGPDGSRSDWYYRSGAAGIDNRALVTASSPYQLRRPGAPVAVLYDGGTASSGEATAISFRGLANTRSLARQRAVAPPRTPPSTCRMAHGSC